MRRPLEFRGSSTVLFGPILKLAFFSMLTLGIYAPWGIANLRRRVLENTYCDGYPLRYDGTGGDLFVLALKIMLLTVITLGIYSLLCFPIVAVLKYDTEHTILPDGTRLSYNGSALGMFGKLLLVGLLSLITLGIYSFWGYASVRRHILNNTYAQGQPLEFTGTGGQYLGIVLVNLLLTVITLGIYALLGADQVRQLRWDARNTWLAPAPMYNTPNQYWGAPYPPPIQVNVTVNR